MNPIDKKTDSSLERRAFTHKLGAFASATMISRILGYIRDSMVAAFFGGGVETDAFYAAFKIPNLIRRFLGEGALTAAFVPVFSGTLHEKGKEEARQLFNALLSGLLIVLVVLVSLGILFAPLVTKVVSYGFTRDPEKFDLAVQLTRLLFPFLLLISVAALITAVLNSCDQFFVPAIAPSGLSIAEVAFILFLASRMSSPIEGLAVSAVAGAALHLIWQLPSLYRAGYHLKLVRPFSHPGVKNVFLLMIPTVIGLCADQVNSFVDQFCASFLRDGSITALYNSSRVMQLPLALFGVAVASVSLPTLSKAASAKDDTKFKELLSFSIRIANFVLIPSFIGLAVLGHPIVEVLFEHGKFLRSQTNLTYYALVPAAAGLPAFSAIKILASAFYAKKNTKTPVRIALWAMAINVVLNVLLMWKLEVAGLALATTIAAWFQVITMFFLLRREIGQLGGREMTRSFLFGTIAGTAMGICCYVTAFIVLANAHAILRVAASIGFGVVFYFLVARALKIPEYNFFVDAVLRRNRNGR